MRILPNGVAVTGKTHHAEWCSSGLVHDRWMAGIIAQQIAMRNIRLCIDGGCHIGTLSRVMLDAGARVIGIDANEDALNCARHNCRSENIEFIEAALCNHHGLDVRLNIDSDNAGATYCSSDLHERGGVCVKSIRIDDIAFGEPFGKSLQIGEIGLIKLDVEGCEVEAIRGAKETIHDDRPILIIEINEGALQRRGYARRDIFDLLLDLDYSTTILQPDCKVSDPQYDILCIPS